MSRFPAFGSPLLLGFDEIERMLERAAKSSGDGYPPYNIEKMAGADGHGERFRITLAVAGFDRDDLQVTIEDNQLVVRGRRAEEEGRTYLHRGIAARQFQRAFVLADGLEVSQASLENGLLSIDLQRQEPEKVTRTIEIRDVG